MLLFAGALNKVAGVSIIFYMILHLVIGVYHIALVLCKSSPKGPEVKVFDLSKGVNFTPASLLGLQLASTPTDACQIFLIKIN